MSLESPQLEDGFTPVANTIMDPICRTRLSGTDWDFLHFLWRKTYGWSKPSDIISLTQFCEATGMSRSHVCRTIKRLLALNVIFRHIARIGHGETATYEFNKQVWSWKSLPTLATLPALAIKPLPALAHTTSISTTTTKRLEDKEGGALPKKVTDEPKPKKHPKVVMPVYSISWDDEIRNFAGISDIAMTDWKSRYPLVDVLAETQKAREWLMDTGNRKDNYALFLAGWFRRTQDKLALRVDTSAVMVGGKVVHLSFPDKPEVRVDTETRKPNPAIADLMAKIRG